MKVRTVFQPTLELVVTEQEAHVLEHAGHLFTGTDQELAGHYRAAGLEIPPALKQPAGATTAKTDQVKGA